MSEKNKGRNSSRCSETDNRLKVYTKIQFEDIVDLLGIEFACKLYTTLAGCTLYIPKLSGLRMDFIGAVIRHDFEILRKNKIPPLIARQMVADKFNLKPEIVKGLVLKSRRNVILDKARDEKLINILKRSMYELKKYKIII